MSSRFDTHDQRYNTNDHDTQRIVQMARHTRQRLSTDDTVQDEEALHGEDIQGTRDD